MTEQLVYVRGPESKVHVALLRDGGMFSNEGCNLDDIVGEREVLDELPPDVDQEGLCHNPGCFPKPEDA